jgi:hypothetical protein
VDRGVDDVVAVERADGDELDVLDIEPGQELLELGADLEEPRLAPADEVHLVDRDDEVRNAQQRGDGGVPAALLDHAGAGIDEDDGEVGRRGARHHVARVLHVPGGVGDDELAARRREVAIGDVDGDALLALGAQAVGEVGEIDLAAAGDVGGALEGLELVLHERFGVVEEAADEGGLAVVDAAAGVEAENVHGGGHGNGFDHGGRVHGSEVAGFLAVFHRGLGGLVVGAGAAFGDARGGDLGDDVVHVVGGRFDHAGADDVADGADAHAELAHLLIGLGRDDGVVTGSHCPWRRTHGRWWVK